MIIDEGPFVGLRAKHYRVILADPPWSFASRSMKNQDRLASNHYDVMSLGDIKALPVKSLAAKDCVLFMWVTDTHLRQAFEVIDAWGFVYKTVGFYWTKDNRKSTGKFCGMGFWTRANPEQMLCCLDDDDNQMLLATTGQPKRVAKNVPKLIEAPRREHSRKPDESHDRIERLVEGPYLDLFARESRQGWRTWGNQRTKFDRQQEREALI